jgi:hypothetical protein
LRRKSPTRADPWGEAITVQRSIRSNDMSKRLVAAAVAATVLAVPGTTAAHQGHGKGKGQEKSAQKRAAKEQRRAEQGKKPGSFVFKGVYKGDGVVAVKAGNSRVRKGGFVGTDVTFDLSAAKVVAAESDNVAGLSAGDLQVDDVVVVKARLPRATKAPAAVEEGAEPTAPAVFKARQVIDQTHPPVETEDE